MIQCREECHSYYYAIVNIIYYYIIIMSLLSKLYQGSEQSVHSQENRLPPTKYFPSNLSKSTDAKPLYTGVGASTVFLFDLCRHVR